VTVELGGPELPWCDLTVCGIDYLKIILRARHWWVTPVIPATQEAEIRRIAVQSQPRQIVRPSSQKRGGGVAQGVGPEFKPQYRI
jgi:hypothetical protein